MWRSVHDTDRPAPSSLQQYQFDEGAYVGELARGRFPSGTLIDEDHTQTEQAIESTRTAIASGATTLYEAAFRHGRVLIRADILTRRSPRAKRWTLYEVKKSGSVKEPHLNDLAVQKWVLEGAGITVAQAALVHVNTQYVREGVLDLDELFSVVPLDREISHLADEIGELVPEFLAVLRRASEPCVSIGPHCDDPYECEYKVSCWTGMPENPVLELTRGGARAWRYWHAGVRSIEEIPLDDPLSRTQRVQVELAKNGGERFQRKEVAQFLDSLQYPVRFLDFETTNPAVPPHDGLKPYQQMPFQFSVHRLEGPGVDPVHQQFLAEDASDPRSRLIDALLRALGESGSIAVWNQAFEARVCLELAQSHAGHRRQLTAMVDRMVDLAIPFRRRWVATPEMRGRYSLKYVAPALLGSERSYSQLDIQGGLEASTSFSRMIALGTVSDEKAAIREALVRYCAEDTLNALRIFEWLRERCGSPGRRGVRGR